MFPKKYFQDRTLLFLNLIVVLLALINIIAAVLRINTSQSIAIIRYQVALGLAGYQRASVWQLYSFALAAVLMGVVAVFLSARIYKERRVLSILVLSLTIIALIFNLIVAGAILNLQ
jgi:H+/Cl- antiporter ClcA